MTACPLSPSRLPTLTKSQVKTQEFQQHTSSRPNAIITPLPHTHFKPQNSHNPKKHTRSAITSSSSSTNYLLLLLIPFSFIFPAAITRLSSSSHTHTLLPSPKHSLTHALPSLPTRPQIITIPSIIIICHKFKPPPPPPPSSNRGRRGMGVTQLIAAPVAHIIYVYE